MTDLKYSAELLSARTTLVPPEGAAERLGLQPSTLANLRWRGGGPPYLKVGGRVRYRLTDLAAWLDTRVHTSTSDEG